MRKVFRNGRYANVTATLALIVALGGTSYAAATLPRNSVGSGQIKKGGVGNSDIATNAITTTKVKDRSLKAVDFARNQLPAGPTGPKGDQGPKGDTGATGAFGAATVRSTTAAVDLADGAKASYDAFCPAGQQAI